MQAVELLGEMRRRRMVANQHTCSSVMSALQRGSEWQQAIEVFATATARHLEPSTVLCNALLSAVAHDWPRALAILEQLVEASSGPGGRI